MTVAFALAWWHIPTLATLTALGWLTYFHVHAARNDGFFAGILTLFMSIPTLVLITITWIIAGALK